MDKYTYRVTWSEEDGEYVCEVTGLIQDPQYQNRRALSVGSFADRFQKTLVGKDRPLSISALGKTLSLALKELGVALQLALETYEEDNEN